MDIDLFFSVVFLLAIHLIAIVTAYAARASLKNRPWWIKCVLGVGFVVGDLLLMSTFPAFHEAEYVVAGLVLLILSLCGVIALAIYSKRPSNPDTAVTNSRAGAAVRFYKTLKSSSAKIKYCYGACAAFGLFCIIGMFDFGSGYYHFLRLFSLFALGITIIAFSTEIETFFSPVSLIAGTLVILFNPISPIFTDKATWQFIDFISAIVSFWLSIYIVKKSAQSAQ